jgi:hypothetical protein
MYDNYSPAGDVTGNYEDAGALAFARQAAAPGSAAPFVVDEWDNIIPTIAISQIEE